LKKQRTNAKDKNTLKKSATKDFNFLKDERTQCQDQKIRNQKETKQKKVLKRKKFTRCF